MNLRYYIAARSLNILPVNVTTKLSANKARANRGTKKKRQVNIGGEIRDTKTLNLPRNIVSFQVFVHVSRFSPYSINSTRNKNICCGLKESVAISRALVYFEQQILALLLVFHNLSRNKCRHIRSTPSKSTNQRAAFLQPVTNVAEKWKKLIAQGEKRETSTKTCIETTLRDKLRVSVSRISPP